MFILQAFIVFLLPLTQAAVNLILFVRKLSKLKPENNKNALLLIGFLILAFGVFPLSLYRSIIITEPCYGQGSGVYYEAHPMLCGTELVQGIPLWVAVLSFLDVFILWLCGKYLSGNYSGKKKLFAFLLGFGYFFWVCSWIPYILESMI